MRVNPIIIDDFLPNPLEVREFALNQEYSRAVSLGHYPGVNSTKSFISDQLLERFREITGCTHIWWPKKASVGHYRVTFAGDASTHNIHWDRIDWSAVLYLSLPEHCQGGTTFWRHKKTQWDAMPTQEEWLKAGAIDVDIVEKDANDLSKWEPVGELEMKFNRLVMYPSIYFHSASGGFGNTFDNSRLIQTFFFNAGHKHG